jgi:hypothetical protein
LAFLLPRGGGAFLNEVDGNLTGVKNDDVTTVHWQGKFRGTEFDPIPFEIVRNITASRLRDSKGRLIKTVIARPLTDKQHSEIEARAHGEADAVLIIMLENEVADIKASIADIAEKAGYGRNQKYKAQRILDRLKKGKLATLESAVHTR